MCLGKCWNTGLIGSAAEKITSVRPLQSRHRLPRQDMRTLSFYSIERHPVAGTACWHVESKWWRRRRIILHCSNARDLLTLSDHFKKHLTNPADEREPSHPLA